MKAQVITICGSLRFQDKIMEEAFKLEKSGKCVITPIFSTNIDKDNISLDELKVLGDMHKQKIKMSDAIYVVNVDGYIGESVRDEINYAKDLGKEIIYYEKI